MKPSNPAQPFALIMVGIPGAGKTTFAEQFSKVFHTPLLRLAAFQKEYSLTSSRTQIFANEITKEFIKTQRTIVIDGFSDTRAQRTQLAALFQKTSYNILYIWVQTDTKEAQRRATKKYPLGSGLTEDVFTAHVSRFEVPVASEKTVVISGKHTYTTQLKGVLRAMASVTPVQSHHTR